MIIFHDQKTLSINFKITYVFLHHYVSTKIFIEYLFLNIFLFLLICFGDRSSCQRCSVKQDVLKNFANFTGKHLHWSLFFIKLQTFQAMLENIWERLLLWQTFPRIYNYLFERAKILFCYYLCLNVAACNFVKNGLSHKCFCFLKTCCKWSNEQNPHCFKKCNRPKLQAATLLNKSSIADV